MGKGHDARRKAMRDQKFGRASNSSVDTRTQRNNEQKKNQQSESKRKMTHEEWLRINGSKLREIFLSSYNLTYDTTTHDINTRLAKFLVSKDEITSFEINGENIKLKI